MDTLKIITKMIINPSNLIRLLSTISLVDFNNNTNYDQLVVL